MQSHDKGFSVSEETFVKICGCFQYYQGVSNNSETEHETRAHVNAESN